MHIVFANQWYPPEGGWGGVAAYNHAMARALQELGHRVTVIASRHSKEIAPLSQVEGIQIHRLLLEDSYRLRKLPGIGRHFRGLNQALYGRKVNRALRRLGKTVEIDVVEFAEVNAEGVFFGSAPFCPYVVRCHTPAFVLAASSNSIDLPFDTRLTGKLEKRFIRHAPFLTAPSANMASLIADTCQIPRERITVIPNAVEINTFKNVPAKENHTKVTILHLGRLQSAKGVDVLIDCIPQVVRAIPNARFVFVGGEIGTKRQELETKLRELNCASNVRFIGYVEQEELPRWYAETDICVVPAIQYESFSYTCAQAMAAGRPVVASRIGGIPETVEDGVEGIIVTPGNVSELAEALITLAQNPSLRQSMGLAGRDKVLAQFESHRVAEQTLAVYAKAIEGFSPPLQG